MKNKIKNSSLYLWILPALLWVSAVIVYPILFTIYTSFFHWKGLGFSMRFVGLKNYFEIFNDRRFISALANNMIWLILYLIVPTLLGFILALLLNSKIKGENFFKSIFYFPGVISFVAVGIIFSLIYTNQNGLLNEILKFIKLDFLTRSWLGTRLFALPAVISAASWQYFGFCMILFLAALQQVPQPLIEAAELDGANYFQRLRYIIIPTIKPVTTIVILITIINSLRVFDIVLVMTSGGPGQMTEVVSLLMYKKSFINMSWGEGSAYGAIILMLVAIPSILYVRNMLSSEEKL